MFLKVSLNQTSIFFGAFFTIFSSIFFLPRNCGFFNIYIFFFWWPLLQLFSSLDKRQDLKFHIQTISKYNSPTRTLEQERPIMSIFLNFLSTKYDMPYFVLSFISILSDFIATWRIFFYILSVNGKIFHNIEKKNNLLEILGRLSCG